VPTWALILTACAAAGTKGTDAEGTFVPPASDSGTFAAEGGRSDGGSAPEHPRPSPEDASAECGEGGVPELRYEEGSEFPVVVCVVPPSERPPVDAGSAPGDAATAPNRDAGAPDPVADATAGEPPEGLCAELAHDCDTPFYEAKMAGASCELLGPNALRLSYTACEVCGKSGQLIGTDLVIMNCGGCEQVYRQGHASSTLTDALACRPVSLIKWDLQRTEAQNCIDVYGSVNSSAGNDISVGLHQIRICRCDRSTGTCVMCADGNCDG
jgi:hypothetical protein